MNSKKRYYLLYVLLAVNCFIQCNTPQLYSCIALNQKNCVNEYLLDTQIINNTYTFTPINIKTVIIQAAGLEHNKITVTPLEWAALNNRTQIVGTLLSSPVLDLSAHKQGVQALLIALDKNNRSITEQLIQKKLSFTDEELDKVLDLAIQNEDLAVINNLIMRPDIRKRQLHTRIKIESSIEKTIEQPFMAVVYGRAIFMSRIAVLTNILQLTKQSITNDLSGENQDNSNLSQDLLSPFFETDETGTTLLMKAANLGLQSSLKILVQFPGIDLHAKNKSDQTAIDLAADKEIILILQKAIKGEVAENSFLDHIARTVHKSINAISTAFSSLVSRIRKQTHQEEKKNKLHMPIYASESATKNLMNCAATGNIFQFDKLLAQGADINRRVPMHEIENISDYITYLFVPSPFTHTPINRMTKVTPLEIATANNQLLMVMKITRAPSFNSNIYYQTAQALILALTRNYKLIANYLTNITFDVQAEQKRTIVDLAIKNNDSESIKHLLTNKSFTDGTYTSEYIINNTKTNDIRPLSEFILIQALQYNKPNIIPLINDTVNPNIILPDGWPLLARAAEREYTQFVSELVKIAGINLYEKNPDGKTALQVAKSGAKTILKKAENPNASLGFIENAQNAVSKFLAAMPFKSQKKPVLQEINPQEETKKLIECSFKGDLACMKIALEHGADINGSVAHQKGFPQNLDLKITALSAATYKKNTDAIKLILHEKDFNPDAHNQLIDALKLAYTGRDNETFLIILKTGLQLNTIQKNSLIEFAIRTDNPSIIVLLQKQKLEKNTRINFFTGKKTFQEIPLQEYIFEEVLRLDKPNILKWVLENYDMPLNELDKDGYTPLMKVASKGNARAVQVLLADKRVDANIKNEKGLSAFDLASSTNIKSQLSAHLHGSQPSGLKSFFGFFNTLKNFKNIQLQNAKFLYSWLNKKIARKPIDSLEENRAKALLKKIGITFLVLLHLADLYNMYEVTLYNELFDYIKRGSPFRFIQSPLRIYGVNKQLGTLAPRPQRLPRGSTPLMVAAKYKNDDVFNHLIADPAIKVNLTDSTKKTALHYAVESHNDKAVCELLKHRTIKPYIKDKKNQTAFDIAAKMVTSTNMHRCINEWKKKKFDNAVRMINKNKNLPQLPPEIWNKEIGKHIY